MEFDLILSLSLSRMIVEIGDKITNKIKLEVTRINEDVIATSSVCQHQDKNHCLITNVTDSFIIGYVFNVKKGTNSLANDLKTYFPGAQPKVNTFYYYDGSEYKICEGSHDFSSYTEYDPR